MLSPRHCIVVGTPSSFKLVPSSSPTASWLWPFSPLSSASVSILSVVYAGSASSACLFSVDVSCSKFCLFLSSHLTYLFSLSHVLHTPSVPSLISNILISDFYFDEGLEPTLMSVKDFLSITLKILSYHFVSSILNLVFLHILHLS